MIKRQRKAILLVALACLVVLVCTAQRMAGLHALVMNATAVTQSIQQGEDTAEAPVTPCELSAKSLLAARRCCLKARCLPSRYCSRCWRQYRRALSASGLPALFPLPGYGCICDCASSVNEDFPDSSG
ncbi:suppression of copper sensitivity: putative copper binding protein ScsA [Raoultella ornithinolytica]|nr:suppression of copper sensitivity: putative copper binding protein ScsA [Raoultella ornithinolytica]